MPKVGKISLLFPVYFRQSLCFGDVHIVSKLVLVLSHFYTYSYKNDLRLKLILRLEQLLIF